MKKGNDDKIKSEGIEEYPCRVCWVQGKFIKKEEVLWTSVDCS
jgi:hypothetical protein